MGKAILCCSFCSPLSFVFWFSVLLRYQKNSSPTKTVLVTFLHYKSNLQHHCSVLAHTGRLSVPLFASGSKECIHTREGAISYPKAQWCVLAHTQAADNCCRLLWLHRVALCPGAHMCTLWCPPSAPGRGQSLRE